MGNCCCCCGSHSSHQNIPGITSNGEGSLGHLLIENTYEEDKEKFCSPNPNLLPEISPRKRRIVVAIYDYDARATTDLSFKKGDRMVIVDDDEGEWLNVLHQGTNRVGYIPGNYVAPEKSVESEDWFFPNMSRKEAENLLLGGEHSRGTFIVRPSEHNRSGYSLSVKDWNENMRHHVKHYKIMASVRGYYISTTKICDTVSDLVATYSENSYGLCHVLTKPCRKPKPTMWDLAPTHRDKWEIPRNEIQLIECLGKGNFGEVFYGKWNNSIDVAVKTLREGTMSTEAFLQEAAIMKTFRHKRIVTLYGVCSENGPIYIVQEYMNKGSLLDLLRNDHRSNLVFEELIYIAFQVASGMEYLESKQLIHRDLAARNVLIGENNIAKICDFGLARVIKGNEYCSRKGTSFPVKWTAPEAILYGKFSIKSDVWSYGILLMEIFTFGQIPYPGMHSREVTDLIAKGYRMPKSTSHPFPDEIYEIMLHCWDAVPKKRPTFEFLMHFFEGYNAASEVPYREVSD